jgi:hypothetical protein
MDRAARFAAADTLAEIRPDLIAEEPEMDRSRAHRDAVLAAIQHTGPKFRITKPTRLLSARIARGLHNAG